MGSNWLSSSSWGLAVLTAEAGIDARAEAALAMVAEALAGAVDLLTGDMRGRRLDERPSDERARLWLAAKVALADRIGFLSGGALFDTVSDARAALTDLEDEWGDQQADLIRDYVSRGVRDAIDYYPRALASGFDRAVRAARRGERNR
jgi:hypothetical protein